MMTPKKQKGKPKVEQTAPIKVGPGKSGAAGRVIDDPTKEQRKRTNMKLKGGYKNSTRV